MSTNTLKISRENAMKAFAQANGNNKQMLSNLFGAEVFSQKITDRVKTFEDACQVLGMHPKAPFTGGESKDEAAYIKLKTIARALNEGWTPDWTDSNQAKYWPYFDSYKPGVGFSCYDYVCWSTITYVGSRLCYKSAELAKYAGTQFLSIYNDFLTL